MQSALPFFPSYHPPHPLVFNSVFLSHFFAISTRVELPPKREMSADLSSILDVVPHALMRAFIIAACLPEPLFPWGSKAVFCLAKIKRIVQGSGPWWFQTSNSISVAMNQNYIKRNRCFQLRHVNGMTRTGCLKPGRATAVPTCCTKLFSATSRYGSSTSRLQKERSCRLSFTGL